MDQITRITLTVTGTSRRRYADTTSTVPDPSTDGLQALAEDRLIRGLHPQVAEQLQTGPATRVRAFTRLPSADEEIYLFKAVAKTNQADEAPDSDWARSVT